MIVLPSLCQSLIKVLQEAHLGITRMKSLACSYMWWRGIDADMEDEARKCHTCQTEWKSPPLTPVHLWQWPDHPWYRVHIDYAGTFMGKMFLLLVDAHSKWTNIHISSTSSSQSTI